MNPTKAQRTWHSLSLKWRSRSPYSSSSFYSRRRSKKLKVKKGILTNFIPVKVINAITGEATNGYIQAASARKLINWLGYHNHKADVEQVYFPKNSTFAHLSTAQLQGFPILIKIGKYQFPYIISIPLNEYDMKKKRLLFFLRLQTVDNLKYLETIVNRKEEIMKVFNKIKQLKKLARKTIEKNFPKRKKR